MSHRKQRSAFDQVSEIDRGRIVNYRDCGLSSREIGSPVGRNQTTVKLICDRWMQESTTYPPQCTTSRSTRTIRHRLQQSGLSARRPLLGLSLTQNHRRLRRQRCDERRMWMAEWHEVVFTVESRICLQHHDGRIRVWSHSGERMLNSCFMHRHIVPAPGIMVWGSIGYHFSPPFVRIDSTTYPRCWSQLSFLTVRGWPQPYFNRIMRDHTWNALSKGSSSITRFNCFPGRLAIRIFHR
ncbi:transposable element Tcb1 transposase [Trichonephila clavipes]|nr:transposable element Tcb1 transposase [Trichonephila clavipes]